MIFHTTSRKPILLAGSGVRSAGAQELLLELGEKTHIPVVTTMPAADLVPEGMNFGFIGTYGKRISNILVHECDLLISVGARLGLRQAGRDPRHFAPDARLIRNDIDPREMERPVKEGEETYLLDAGEFLRKLLAEKIPDYAGWKMRCTEAAELLEGVDAGTGNLAVRKISELLPENPVVAADVGQHMCWCAQSLKLKGGKGRILFGGSYGSMGCSLPFAVGASFADRNAKVFCITGDGGLQMNIQELETAVREKLPVKILVLNNHALGKIRETQAESYEGRFSQTTAGSGYSVPDFRKVAEAYGMRAASLSSYSELDRYRKWLWDDKACLLDISLPEDTCLIPKTDWTDGSVSPALDEALGQKVMEILKS